MTEPARAAGAAYVKYSGQTSINASCPLRPRITRAPAAGCRATTQSAACGMRICASRCKPSGNALPAASPRARASQTSRSVSAAVRRASQCRQGSNGVDGFHAALRCAALRQAGAPGSARTRARASHIAARARPRCARCATLCAERAAQHQCQRATVRCALRRPTPAACQAACRAERTRRQHARCPLCGASSCRQRVRRGYWLGLRIRLRSAQLPQQAWTAATARGVSVTSASISSAHAPLQAARPPPEMACRQAVRWRLAELSRRRSTCSICPCTRCRRPHSCVPCRRRRAGVRCTAACRTRAACTPARTRRRPCAPRSSAGTRTRRRSS